ncbi:MAG: AraC family transcriptional regulator [Spirochaetes bacterium]|nr:AraC family transcriptional regulator [Spirochaetota bacterium]
MAILCCSAVTFFKSLEQVLVSRPRRTNYILAILLACIGYIQVCLGILFTGTSVIMPLELFLAGFVLFISAAYLAAPLAFFYYNALVNTPPEKKYLHILPSAAMTLLIVLYLATAPGAYRLGVWNNFFTANHGAPVLIVLGGAVASEVVYLAIILRVELAVKNSKTIQYAVRSLIVVTGSFILAPVALFAGFILQWMWLSAMGALLVSIDIILFILAHVRYQDFFQFLGKELRLARYRKSLLKGIDTAVLLDRLNYLMNEEKYYRDFDISIKSTAEALDITPHQLSMYLNKKLHIDFRNYINRYRVEEAKQLLVEKLDHNVLTIGFHVGFGSKTSFNVTFKEFTGRTPSRFREEHLATAAHGEGGELAR